MEKPKIINIDHHGDSRGTLEFCNSFNMFEAGIKRFYTVENSKINTVRAWHGHKKEKKFILVLRGEAIISAIPIKNFEEFINFECDRKEIYTYHVTAKFPQIIYIPAGYYNGTMTLTEDTKLLIFSTSTVNESKDDDFRQDPESFEAWNTPGVILTS